MLSVPPLKLGTYKRAPSALKAAASGALPTAIVAETTGGFWVRSITLPLFGPWLATYALVADPAPPVGVVPTDTTGSAKALARTNDRTTPADKRRRTASRLLTPTTTRPQRSLRTSPTRSADAHNSCSAGATKPSASVARFAASSAGTAAPAPAERA